MGERLSRSEVVTDSGVEDKRPVCPKYTISRDRFYDPNTHGDGEPQRVFIRESQGMKAVHWSQVFPYII